MKTTLNRIILIAGLLIPCIVGVSYAQAADETETAETVEIPANEKLVVVWTSGDREVALKMVFMYTFNSRRFNWWQDITLVVWGPSAKLLAEDKELQDYIAKIKESGTALKACKACADEYGVSEQLEALGITVKYMGELTDYIKEGRHVITF